jgi:hypothetical protein
MQGSLPRSTSLDASALAGAVPSATRPPALASGVEEEVSLAAVGADLMRVNEGCNQRSSVCHPYVIRAHQSSSDAIGSHQAAIRMSSEFIRGHQVQSVAIKRTMRVHRWTSQESWR